MLLRQGAQFVVGIVLARLVAPAEFGAIASLMLFTGIASLLVESGLGAALIQRRDLSSEDESTAFWFNVASGSALALALAAAAPWIGGFFGEPRLVPLAWAMALNLWLSAWISVHVALLARNLDFRTQAIASAAATLTGGIVAIVLAAQGAGVWALAAQLLVATAVNVLLIWWLSPWRPALVFRWGSFRRLFGFGSFLVLSSLIDVVASRIHTILIGKWYSTHDLGIYSRALSTKDAPQDLLALVCYRVGLPVFSAQAHDPARLRASLRVALLTMMAVNLPVMLGIWVIAGVLVPALFGSQWIPAVPVLRVLCVAGLFWPFHAANLNALMALGHSRLFFRLELVKKGLLILLTALASQWSMLAIAGAAAVSSFAALFINTHYTRKFLAYSALDQLRDVAPSAALACAMAAVLLIMGNWLESLPQLAVLAVQILAGAAIYLGAGFALRLAALRHFMNLIHALVEGSTRQVPDSKAG